MCCLATVGSAQENRTVGAIQGTAEDLKEWRELNLRWWQFGALSPLFRSHGEVVKREIHEISPEGSPMRDSMVWYDKLRYRMMPYIYSTAATTHYDSGTIMRGLVVAAFERRVCPVDMYGEAFGKGNGNHPLS